jgi:uncharacterized protein
MIVAFGMFTGSSLYQFFGPSGETQITDEALRSIILVELVFFAILAVFLRARGWTLSAIGLKPDLRQTLHGIGLLLIALCISAATSLFDNSSTIVAGPGDATLIAPKIPFLTIAALSVVNAIYEEVFVTGYMMSALMERFSGLLAILLSATLRTTYHLYQGAFAAFSIGLIGLLFAIYYQRQGKLWPLIVAHGLLDFSALSSSWLPN